MRAKPVPPAWAGPITAWTSHLRAAGQPATTIATRTDHLRRCARALPAGPWQVTTADLTAWAGAQTWARETRRGVRASLRSFYAWAVAAGLTTADPAERLPVVEPAPANPRPAPEAVYRQALAVADERTRLILRLAGEVGLRRAEIAVVHARDVTEDLLGRSLRVHGKGGKERTVPLPVGLGLELARHEGWVFPGDDAGHLSPRWVGTLAARVLPTGWTLHTLRHRFATRAYAVERDLLAVQTLLGHSSPATTRRYVAVPDDALRRTVLAVAG